MVKGAGRRTALIHPGDATSRGPADGQRVSLTSAVGALEIVLEATDEVRPGVVGIPHGRGHTAPGTWSTPANHSGVNVDDVTDARLVDSLSGNAAINATRVSVSSAD